MLGSIFVLQIFQVLGRSLFFLFSIWYLNRYLGVEAKGLWTGIYSLFGILAVCSNMGFEVWLSRAAAASAISSRQAVRFLFKTKSGLWLICLAAGSLYVIHDGYSIGLAIPFGIALILDGIGVAEQAVYEGKRHTTPMAILSFLKSGGFSLIALLFAFLTGSRDLVHFAWLFALILGLRALWGWRCWALLPDHSAPLRKDAWREFMLMGAYTMVTVIYFKIDAVMLIKLSGSEVTGNYGNAYDFVEGTLFISAAVSSVLYPRLVVAEDASKKTLFDLLFRFILVTALLGTVCFWFLAGPTGLFFAGSGFQGAIEPLMILAWGLPFMFGNGLLSRWLFSAHRERFALLTATGLALFNIIGNWLVIPEYGAEGASAMTIATEGLLFLIWLGLGRRSAVLFLYLAMLLVPLAAVAYFRFYHAVSWVGFIIGGVVYFPLVLHYIRRIHRMKLSHP